MKKSLWLYMIAIIMLSSCNSQKDIIYLHDMEMGQFYPIEQKHDPIVHRDDRLSIVVNSKKPELAIPFNIAQGGYTVTNNGNVATSAQATPTAATREKGYRVDINGNIEFPLLGTLHVEGLTISQVTDLIRERIIEGGYINDPLVMVEILNFKYTVLGAVEDLGIGSFRCPHHTVHQITEGTHQIKGKFLTCLNIIVVNKSFVFIGKKMETSTINPQEIIA